jgi:hypothetical protein
MRPYPVTRRIGAKWLKKITGRLVEAPGREWECCISLNLFAWNGRRDVPKYR